MWGVVKITPHFSFCCLFKEKTVPFLHDIPLVANVAEFIAADDKPRSEKSTSVQETVPAVTIESHGLW